MNFTQFIVAPYFQITSSDLIMTYNNTLNAEVRRFRLKHQLNHQIKMYLSQVSVSSGKGLPRSFPLIGCQIKLPACIAFEHLCQDYEKLKFIALSKDHITFPDQQAHHNDIGNAISKETQWKWYVWLIAVFTESFPTFAPWSNGIMVD